MQTHFKKENTSGQFPIQDFSSPLLMSIDFAQRYKYPKGFLQSLFQLGYCIGKKGNTSVKP